MADVGEKQYEIEVTPIPAPVEVPTPVKTPEREMEPVT